MIGPEQALDYIPSPAHFPGSSMVERPAVNEKIPQAKNESLSSSRSSIIPIYQK